MGWLIPRQDLSLEQLRAVELNTQSHHIIVGAPGSGKTQILLHRAASLRESLRTTPDRFQILVFTNVLKDYIRSALVELGIPESNVTTFDDWCRRKYEVLVSNRLPWDRVAHTPDFPTIRRGLLSKLNESLAEFDFVLVDEGQDLEPECFHILRAIARHVTVCFDHKQQIYDRGSTYTAALEGLGIKDRPFRLTEAYRCCPYIIEIAAEYVDDPQERTAFLNQIRTKQSERLTPLVYEASDFNDERENMVAVVRQRLLEDRSIAILFPMKRQVEGFANAFREAQIPVETQRDGLNFGNNVPKLMTFHSAKGLTFDTVLLPRLVSSSFPRASSERIRKLLYVGITRATKWVYISYVPPALKEVHLLQDIVSRRPAPIAFTSQRMPQPQTSPRSIGTGAGTFDLL